jgi:hypothetical protein
LLEAVARISERQRRYARDILMDELKQGRTLIENVEEVDELAAITLGYIHSAAGGSARLNLRLMAMVIAGLAQRKTLVSSRFLYYASFLSSLSREEIISASTLCRNEQKATKNNLARKSSSGQNSCLDKRRTRSILLYY